MTGLASASAKTRILLDAVRSAEEHMALDERLAREGSPLLRLFGWRGPAFSLGRRQALPAWLDAERVRADGIELIERPTGGGLACHGTDLSCAVVALMQIGLRVHALMQRACEAVAAVCASFGVRATSMLDVPADRPITICLAEPSSYAVFSGARKLAGFALRRYPQSWLVQGSLLVRPISKVLLKAMPPSVGQQLLTRAVSLSEAAGSELQEHEVAQRWARLWSEGGA